MILKEAVANKDALQSLWQVPPGKSQQTHFGGKIISSSVDESHFYSNMIYAFPKITALCKIKI